MLHHHLGLAGRRCGHGVHCGLLLQPVECHGKVESERAESSSPEIYPKYQHTFTNK